jgi:hypothetical protein
MVWGLVLMACAIAWTGVVPHYASAQSDERIALEVSEVMVLGGIDIALDQIPDLIAVQINSRRDQLDPAVVQRMESAMLEAYAPALLKADARVGVSQHYDAQVFEKARLWLRSPIGVAFTAMEIEAGKEENHAKLVQFVESLPTNPPTRERLVLVSNIIRATETLKTVIDMLVIVAEPILHTVNALAPPEEQRNPDQVEAMLAVMRDNLEEPMGKQIMIRSLFTYRDATEEQLTVYFSFLKSEEGQALYTALNTGIVVALENASERFAADLEQVIGAQATENGQ